MSMSLGRNSTARSSNWRFSSVCMSRCWKPRSSRRLDDLGFQQRLMQTLEKRQLLDRAVEFLPSDMDIAERRRRAQPLTRPELAVLLAYAKLTLHDDLLASHVPDDPYLA